MINGAALQKYCTKRKFGVIDQLKSINVEPSQGPMDANMERALSQFKKMFQEPAWLPSPRNQDHHIHLQPNASPVNVRPCKYPHIQISKIGKIIKGLLDSSVVRQSMSPFAYPFSPIKKKGGTQRLCVDYRELNIITIKNQIPIPVIYEFLDELYGSAVYSKI